MLLLSREVKAFPINDNAADWLLGQPDYTTGYNPNASNGLAGAPETAANSFFVPYDVTYDSTNDRLFVADMHNHRVSIFSLSGGFPTGLSASYVLGQTSTTLGGASTSIPYGNTDTQNPSAGCTTAINACGMKRVYSIAFDSANSRLFVADSDNHRVLVWNLGSGISNGMAASYVLGQTTMTTNVRNQKCGAVGVAAPNACGLNFPTSVEYDGSNKRLYVSDQNNNRVVMYDVSGTIANGMAASKVFGQPVLTRGSANTPCGGAGSGAGTTNQCGLSGPTSVAVDSVNQRIFVSDLGNHRIVAYPTVSPISNGAAATHVLGQPHFTVATANTSCGGGSSGETNTNGCGFGVYETFLDYQANRLMVSDVANHRVLFFDTSVITNGEMAVGVLGQSNMTTGYNPNASGWGGATTRSRMLVPEGISFDSASDRFFVADGGNHRIMVFGPAILVAINIAPSTTSIAKGNSLAFTATGVYSDNSTVDLTSSATWASNRPSVASVSNAAPNVGQVTAVTVGNAEITATLGSIVGNRTISVTPAELVSIAITPNTPSVPQGFTQQMVATGTYTDATTQALTSTVTWASNAPEVASISNASGSAGLATGISLGSAGITATFGSVVGSVTLATTPTTVITDFSATRPLTFAYALTSWSAAGKQYRSFTDGAISGQEVLPIGLGTPDVSGGAGATGLSMNLSTATALALRVRLLSGNQATAVQVLLFDSDGTILRFNFPTSSFNTSTFANGVVNFSAATTVAVGATPGFNKSNVTVYEVQGNYTDLLGLALFKMQFDTLTGI